jgi:hypothetical protein
MKFEKNDEMDLGFQVPAAGTYAWQIQEGIDKFHNEDSGKTSLMLPMQIIAVIEGELESMNGKATHFIPIETPFGEKQLNTILTITGLIDDFAKHFADASPTDEKVLGKLKIKLPGKIIKATHEIRKNQKGRENANFTHFGKYDKDGKQPASKEGKTEGAEETGW